MKTTQEIFQEIADAAKIETGLSDKDLAETLEIQKEAFIEYISFKCFSDKEKTDSASQARHKIYKVYNETISQLISKIEVYKNDLGKGVFDIVYDLFNSLAATVNFSAEHSTDKVLNTLYAVKHIISIKLIEAYLNRIKNYRRVIRNFNHQGIRIATDNNKKFDDVVKSKYKSLKSRYKNIKKICDSLIDKTAHEYNDTEEFIGLEKLIEDAEILLTIYESHYAQVLDNGYNNAGPYRVFNFVMIAASLGFAVFAIVMFVSKFM